MADSSAIGPMSDVTRDVLTKMGMNVEVVVTDAGTLQQQWRHEATTRAVWLYHGLSRSVRDVEMLLAGRGVVVSYETIRRWCKKFGQSFASRRAAAGHGRRPSRRRRERRASASDARQLRLRHLCRQ